MPTPTFRFRLATPDDAPALLAIYAPYVEQTAISFEYDVPSLEEFRRRIADFSRNYPYLIAEDTSGHALGYAYTHTFIPRAAYDRCAETTIYLSLESRHQGLGKRLYRSLEDISRAQGIYNLYACIGEPQGENDEYLTDNSIRFHEHLGFRRIGVFRRCGYKFGRWYDMSWAEKLLGEPPEAPGPIIPFLQLDRTLVTEILRCAAE